MPELERSRSSIAGAKLAARAEAGLARRLTHARRHAPIDEEVYRRRCHHELDVIQRLGFADHFLTVSNIVDVARTRGIRVGPGRGSTPGSVVAWALGITDIDPVRFKLVFERFLNVDRANSCAVSIDVCARRRSELLDRFDPICHADLAVGPLLALTLAQDVVDRVNARRGNPSLDNIAVDDTAVFAMIASGDTSGVFWFDEDDGFAALAQRLAPSCFEDLMLIFTLHRPGPLEHGVVDTVIARKSGRASCNAINSALDAILADTYGVLVYQEQLIQIAHDVAGFPYTQGDLLRRALGKRRPAEIADARERFVVGAVGNGIGEVAANAIFDHFLEMSGLGFSRAHATAYCCLAYQIAYLKHYFPDEFADAVEHHRNSERPMNCDTCRTSIGPTPGETFYVCACGHRYCWRCGQGRYKCERCQQEQRIAERRT